MVDLEPGHIIPTFSIARSLKDASHEILYLGFCDSEELIRNEGFNFHPLFAQTYPKGFISEYKRLIVDDSNRGFDQHFGEFSGDYFEKLIENFNPALFIVSSFLSIEILVLYYKYNINPIILSPRLYNTSSQFAKICTEEIFNLPADASILLFDLLAENKIKYSSFLEVVEPLNQLLHFIVCAQAFEKEIPSIKENTVYVSAGIRLPPVTRNQAKSDYRSKKIIYASMGSQSQIYAEKYKSVFLKKI